MEEAVERAMKEIVKRRTDLDDAEMLKIAEQVGIGAIRYYIARLSPEKHIIFKWDEALSFERGCASIQYSHARACKLLEKANHNKDTTDDITDWVFEHPFEIELVKIISKFSSVIEESARINRVHNIAQYSQDLASAFNKYYKSVQVIGSEKEDLRLLLVDKSRITIRNCLKLMGIEAPDVM
jgi:arginyl-tRNA synthetase